jgi:hypothetical protein
MRSLTLVIAFAMAVFLTQSSPSHAVEIDFSTIGGPGNLGVTSFTDLATGLTVSGYYFDGVAWVPANLYVRNDVGDHGFGVCSPIEAAANGGDCPVNEELDNAGQRELIVLQLPAGYEWVSVQVSSLDTNNGVPPAERGVLYADNDGVFNSTGGSVGDNAIQLFGGDTDPLEAVFGIGPAYTQAPYLVFEPFDHSGGGGTNNDYLVFKATLQASEGGEGCTPGYWKQAFHFDSWNVYSPGNSYDSVFGVTSSFGPTFTLLQALQQGGGGEKALGRHAVAALLNSVSPDVSYEFTNTEVIETVQEAYATGDFETAKDLLADQNELGCPLN